MKFVMAGLLAVCMTSQAWATECVGTNLFETMTDERRAEIDAAVEGVPFAKGILWEATKGDQHITLIGTYHFSDPRHDSMLARVQPDFDRAAALYVEAGPEEQKRLTEALAADPNLMVNPDGPTLPERLSDKEWQQLSDAMTERGSPAIITSKLRPWYVAMMLGISPCMINQMATGTQMEGLDQMLMGKAEEMDLPIKPLEPWDTVFTLFADMTPEQEVDMLRAALPTAAHADDYGITLSDAYFRGDIWAIWEFGRFDAYDNSDLSHEAIDEQMELAQAQLMDKRNQSWIAPLTKGAKDAAAEGKGIVAGFGALHLPGEQGVLQLLQDDGWSIRRLDG